MFASTRLNKLLAGTSIVAAGFALSMNVAAGPIDWAAWSGATTGNTTGSASAAFDSGLTASYHGELQSLVINYPSYAPASTFSGGTVANAPAQADGILQIFGGTAAGTNTITFSQAVLNPVLAIWSLGQSGITAQFNFNTAFAIESGGPSAEYGGTAITSVGNTVFGAEGNGVIQFNGSVTSISWTNPVFENWYGFTLGVPVAAVPEPETYALMLAGLAALGAVTRRRRRKA
jgi:PEP-CTERM motif